METLAALALLLCISMTSMDGCTAAQYMVGGLDAWGVPPSSKPDVYVRWAKYVPVKLSDTLFFLYPPNKDSAMQLTAKAFAACDVSGPLLKLEEATPSSTSPSPGGPTSAAPGLVKSGSYRGSEGKRRRPHPINRHASTKAAGYWGPRRSALDLWLRLEAKPQRALGPRATIDVLGTGVPRLACLRPTAWLC
ncbi:hypothetical protein TRIUR3_16324 [Triticum urartu]|uniref:Uncharacterized protein n=2 Tax=Triticum urartu TaxID=4572 RepID=M7YRI0_TRIUA|nr:hypothetical protein TRIUR3_16324 [Triticum urartu]